MADLREDFIKYVVKALVNNPDEVSLTRSQDEKGEFLELRVDPSDMGKVIGKAGATAKSLRTLLRGVGAKDDLAPLPLKIIDPEGSSRAMAEAPAQQSSERPSEETPEDVPPVEAETPRETPKDEHQELHERTKREMQELADFEL